MKVAIKPIFVVILVVLGLSECKNTIGTGPYMGLQHMDMNKVEDLASLRVSGESCRQHIFFVPIGTQSFPLAYQQAVSTAPAGTTGLKDATLAIKTSYFAFGYLFGRFCAVVEGVPAKLKSPIK